MAFDNTVVAQRYMEEICARANFAMLDELVAKDVIQRDSVTPERRGHDHVKATINEFRSAFPDLTFKIDDVLSTTSDRVVVRWTVRGTHKGSLMGLAATGRPATFKGIDILKIVDGMVREDDAYWDAYGLFQQLGVLPKLDELSRAKPPAAVSSHSGSFPSLR
ncbi:MAG: ester cyclase [Kofleriaceae bacterium]|nr:ester cyclase [Kofleriaceae bacterium]